MASRHKIWFFYGNRRDWNYLSTTISDEQVQSADFEDIQPSFISAISTRLADSESITPNLAFWELNEPGIFQLRLPTEVALEDLATNLHLVEGNLKKEERPLEGDPEDVIEFVKQTKVDSPSTLALANNFQNKRQEMEKWLIDHRHLPATLPPGFVDDLPPISLQYKGFGRFLDIFRGRKDVLGIENVSSSEIRLAVDDFAQKMSLIYPNEFSRMHDGLKALNNILSARTGNRSFHISAGSITHNATSNGHILGPHEAAYCLVQFKNESPSNSITYIEMMGHFLYSTKVSMEKFPSVMRGWNIPCLGLTIVGHYITFYAMIHLRHWRIVALTPALSCIHASGDGDDRKALYNAFTAASVLLAGIREEAAQLVAIPPHPIKGSRSLPAISTLHDPSCLSCVRFKILKKFSFKRPDRYLYTAKTTDGEDIVIKFTPRYSYELHKCCADHGCAPKLLGFQRLPGGFFGIAMEFFQTTKEITEYLGNPNLGKWAKQLEELVAAFHAKGLVHGDLRSPNILCDGEKVMVIDFDWGGKEGEVFYPDTKLHSDLTDGRDSTDSKITKDDDLRVLCKTLGYVGVGCGYCNMDY